MVRGLGRKGKCWPVPPRGRWIATRSRLRANESGSLQQSLRHRCDWNEITLQRGLSWVESRTGLVSFTQDFFLEHIPASAGWPQAFGSVALFLCLIQAVTGILLSFNYAGTPGDAYNSLTYIIREVPMGRMMHGLHHW